jgi:tetratricopeptide (TPR) repeat protein
VKHRLHREHAFPAAAWRTGPRAPPLCTRAPSWRALWLDPKDADAPYNRGLVWAGNGDHDRAIAEFNAALRLDRRHARARYARGLAHQAVGDDAGGAADRAAAKSNRADVAEFFAD